MIMISRMPSRMSRASGSIVWEQDVMRLRSLTTPVPFANTVVVGDFEGYVHFLDVNSGQLAGRLRADKSPIVGTPVVVGDGQLVGRGDIAAPQVTETLPAG